MWFALSQVGGLGIKDYSGRMPNQEQLEDVACKADKQKPGFSFVLDNFAELLDDTFLQNLTEQICQGSKCLLENIYFLSLWDQLQEIQLIFVYLPFSNR